MVYAYNIEAGEYRHEFRKSMDDFLSGASDEKMKAEDTREIQEQVPELADAWAEMDSLFAAPKPAPSAE